MIILTNREYPLIRDSDWLPPLFFSRGKGNKKPPLNLYRLDGG